MQVQRASRVAHNSTSLGSAPALQPEDAEMGGEEVRRACWVRCAKKDVVATAAFSSYAGSLTAGQES